MTFTKRLRAAITAALLVAGLGACSVEFSAGSSDEIDAGDLETKVKNMLMEENPDAPEPSISCPDVLPFEAGATTRCELRVGGSDRGYGVTVEMTEADGTDGNIHAEVDEQPLGPNGLDSTESA